MALECHTILSEQRDIAILSYQTAPGKQHAKTGAGYSYNEAEIVCDIIIFSHAAAGTRYLLAASTVCKISEL